MPTSLEYIQGPRTCALQEPRCPLFVSDLPLELVLHIFSFLPHRSIIQVVLTQKSLYDTFFFDEELYKGLCLRFGVISLSLFHPSRTYRSLYIELLHKFGPLIGHWASDRPFRGNVMEFRVVGFYQVGWEGLICEVWRFPKPRLAQLLGAEDRGVTRPPDFYESFRIVMQPPSNAEAQRSAIPLGGSSDDGSRFTYRPPRIVWFVHNENLDWKHGERDRPSLHLLGPTTQSFYVHEQPTHSRDNDVLSGPVEPSLHPEVPLPTWYDDNRGLPALPQETIPLYDNSFLAHKYSNGVFLFGAPSRTNLVKPPALSIFPPRDFIDRTQLHDPPFVGVGDARNVDRSAEGDITFWRDRGDRLHARYYPLVFPRIAPKLLQVQPEEVDWKPESLVGLWYSAYEIYGSEILFLEWDVRSEEVKAWKVTGDINVPRGAMLWSIHTDATVELNTRSWEIFSQLGVISRETRAYQGSGIVGGRGFVPNQRNNRPITVAIVGTHELRIRWGDVQHTMQCKRFKPRDHTTEFCIRGAGVLRGPWTTS